MKQKEKAKADSATNRSFAESMELSKGDPVTPPDTYNELCKMANTWCALLFSVFGEHGSLCNKTLGLCDTLATESIHQHHDIAPMPNGNILAILWEKYTAEERQGLFYYLLLLQL